MTQLDLERAREGKYTLPRGARISIWGSKGTIDAWMTNNRYSIRFDVDNGVRVYHVDHIKLESAA